jgi:hypothetical protein
VAERHISRLDRAVERFERLLGGAPDRVLAGFPGHAEERVVADPVDPAVGLFEPVPVEGRRRGVFRPSRPARAAERVEKPRGVRGISRPAGDQGPDRGLAVDPRQIKAGR